MANSYTKRDIEMLLISIVTRARAVEMNRRKIAKTLKNTNSQKTLAQLRRLRVKCGQATDDLDKIKVDLAANTRALRAMERRMAAFLCVLRQCHQRLVRIYES